MGCIYACFWTSWARSKDTVLLYPTQWCSVKYTKAQPHVEDACTGQRTPDTRTDLRDWTCQSPCSSLKVHSQLELCMQGILLYILAPLSYLSRAVPQSFFRSSHPALKSSETPPNKTVFSTFRVFIFFINNGQFASMIPGKGKQVNINVNKYIFF